MQNRPWLTASPGEQIAGGSAKAEISADAKTQQLRAAMHVHTGELITGAVEGFQMFHTGAVQRFKLVARTPEVAKIIEFTHIDLGEFTPVNMKASDVTAGFGVRER